MPKLLRNIWGEKHYHQSDDDSDDAILFRGCTLDLHAVSIHRLDAIIYAHFYHEHNFVDTKSFMVCENGLERAVGAATRYLAKHTHVPTQTGGNNEI